MRWTLGFFRRGRDTAEDRFMMREMDELLTTEGLAKRLAAVRVLEQRLPPLPAEPELASACARARELALAALPLAEAIVRGDPWKKEDVMPTLRAADDHYYEMEELPGFRRRRDLQYYQGFVGDAGKLLSSAMIVSVTK